MAFSSAASALASLGSIRIPQMRASHVFRSIASRSAYVAAFASAAESRDRLGGHRERMYLDCVCELAGLRREFTRPSVFVTARVNALVAKYSPYIARVGIVSVARRGRFERVLGSMLGEQHSGSKRHSVQFEVRVTRLVCRGFDGPEVAVRSREPA